MERLTINEQLKWLEKQEQTNEIKSLIASVKALKTKIESPKDCYVAVFGGDMMSLFMQFLSNKI